MRARSVGASGIGALALALLAFGAQDAPPRDAGFELESEAPLGLPSELEPRTWASDAQVELGRALFFDPVLSRDRSVACASCHQPAHGFADPRARSIGVGGQETLRNAPTLYNRALGTSFRWDGKARSLEEQVLLPIQDPREMDLALDEAVARLSADAGYAARFREAFGAAPSSDALARALAAFVRRLLYGASRVDRFRAGEVAALSDEERAGLWFYESRGRCWRCHSGPNFSDEDFHATGVGDGDDGRFAVTGDEADRGRFKTPTLRGLVETAPYMHDGSLATLEDVVAHYRGGAQGRTGLDPRIAPIEMTDDDARHLVAFLRALSSDP